MALYDANPLKRITLDGPLAEAPPPKKVARYTPSSTANKQSTLPSERPFNARSFQPTRKYSSHLESGRDTRFLLPYPLDLLPLSSWHTLRHHQPTQNIQIVCTVCTKLRTAPFHHHRKLFLVAERLLSEPSSTHHYIRQKTEELNSNVNRGLGILDPAINEPGVILGGLHSRTCLHYPFKSEFEMRAALKLLENAAIMNEGGWKIWLDMIDHLPIEDSSPSSPPHNNEVHNGASRHSQAHRLQTLPTPPLLSQFVPCISSKNGSISKIAVGSVLEVEEIDMTGNATPSAQIPKILKSEFKKRRNTSFRTLPDLYQLLDLIERTSYCAARFLEAYAEFLWNDLCSDCWFNRNIRSGDTIITANHPVIARPSAKNYKATMLQKHGQSIPRTKWRSKDRAKH